MMRPCGLKVGRQLATRDPSPDLIGYSAFARDFDRKRTASVGFDMHLQKDLHFSLEQLQRMQEKLKARHLSN
jgi:hypothetical protein